jgi:hypothetical protein
VTARPAQPRINAPPLGPLDPYAGQPVSATFYGAPGDDYARIVERYQVVAGALVIARTTIPRTAGA